MHTRARHIALGTVVVIATAGITLFAWKSHRSRTPVDEQAARLFAQSLPTVTALAGNGLYSGAAQYVAREQLIKMGPDAVPFLVSVVNERQAHTRNLYLEYWPKIPALVRRFFPVPSVSGRDAEEALYLLMRIGRPAAAAAPDLIRLVGNPSLRDTYQIVTTRPGTIWTNGTLMLTRSTNTTTRVQKVSTAHNLRAIAANTLGRIDSDDPRAAWVILKAAENADGWAAVEFRRALASGGRSAAKIVPEMARALNTTNAELRTAIARALLGATAYEPNVFAQLPACLDVESDETRWALVCALEHAGDKGKFSWPVLAGRLAVDPSNRVRGRIAIAFGKLGANTPEVVAALTKALGDPEPNVREAAEEALRNISAAASAPR